MNCQSIIRFAVLFTQYKTVAPVGDRILVKVDKEEAKSVGGVLLPTLSTEKPTAGKIVSVGDVSLVKGGDHVLYSKFSSIDLELDGQEHVLLKVR